MGTHGRGWSARTRPALGLLLAGGVLAGCGGSTKTVTVSAQSTSSAPGATSPTTASSATSPTTASTATSATAATTGTAPATGTTAPGAKLSVGQTATVPYTPPGSESKKFTLKVTVESIKKASLSDFNGIQLDATQKAATPYYVKVKIENAGSGDASKPSDPSVNIEGVDTTKQTQQSVTFFGDFPKCNDQTPPKPLSQGKSFETCLVYLVPGGITAAAYTGSEKYIESPVTWTAG